MKQLPRTIGGYQRRLRTLIRTLRKDAGWMRTALIAIHNRANEGMDAIEEEIEKIQAIAKQPDERGYQATFLLSLLRDVKLLDDTLNRQTPD